MTNQRDAYREARLRREIRRTIAEHGDEWPEPTDDQIREIARLLPPAPYDEAWERQVQAAERELAEHESDGA
jgi:hypothetical protein